MEFFKRVFVSALIVICAINSLFAADPPEARMPTPSARMLEFHREMDGFYAFVHWGLNAWTGKEWGDGSEDPKLFNPREFDADQIVRAARDAGMKGLIITAKHHDGFCLWPSKYTEHSIKNSPWKDGKGDVVREFSDACHRQGMGFGVYLSPWDRNHAEYGRPAYIEYFRNQLREVLTNYGPVFELWLDGANGGNGYYGGARERRTIDKTSYYDWDNTLALIRELQPNACIMSDIGPDIRWVGDGHRGITGDPCWATYTPHPQPGKTKVGLGLTQTKEGLNGHRDGIHWMPAEDPMTLQQHGWFYKPKVRSRTPAALIQLYMQTIGRGANLCLNLSPDRRGLVPERQLVALRAFRKHMDETFKSNLALGSTITASNVRGGDSQFDASLLLDGNRDTYWATDDVVTTAEVVVKLGHPVTFNIIDLREHLPLGQRVETWALDQWQGGAWSEFAAGKAIGSRRLWRGKTLITTERVRIRVSGPVCPALSELGIYREPGIKKTTVAKNAWKVVSATSYAVGGEADKAIDGDPSTLWHTYTRKKEMAAPQHIIVNFGEIKLVSGFNYLPRQDGISNGSVTEYEFYLSRDGVTWHKPTAKGSFDDIADNPVVHNVTFAQPESAQYFKFVVLAVASHKHVTVSEIGIVTAP